MLWRGVGLLLVLLAGACALAPMQPSTVERWYALGLYPSIQAVLTPLSNLVPFAVLDILLIVTLVFCVVRAVRAVRRGRTARPLAGLVGTLLVAASVLYLVFLVLWGFNYRRVPVSEHLDLSAAPPTTAGVVSLGFRAVAQLNRLHAEAHRIGGSEPAGQDETLIRMA